jgi:hypothetical protein
VKPVSILGTTTQFVSFVEKDDYSYVDGEPRAYVLETYHYAKFKLFFVSLLWRASATSRPFFEHVSVGSSPDFSQ